MGENAKFNGQTVKIGTCEEMYYLRADQARLVERLLGNVDPVRDAAELRFRFPWPDEDGTAPGAFDRYERSASPAGLTVPDGVEHHNVQFRADAGYLLSLACPETGAHEPGGWIRTKDGQRIALNGYSGGPAIVQQRLFNERMVLVMKCGGCGAKYRLETLEDARPVIDACHAEAKAKSARDNGGRIDFPPDRWWTAVAQRIEAGYTQPAPF